MTSNTTEVPQVTNLKISEIEAEDGFNPRGKINKESVADLAKSIAQDGVLQAILVREVNGSYKVVAGHRRLMAAQVAGLTEIPAQVRRIEDDEDAKALAFDENEQREDMVPMARAIALNHQYKKLGSFKKVAERRSLTAQQVGALVKMCELPEAVQKIALEHRGFGPDLAKPLIDVAAVPGGEPMAVFLAGHVMKHGTYYRRIRDNLREMLNEVERYRDRAESDQERDSVPFITSLNRIEPIKVTETGKAADLTARGIAARKVFPEYGGHGIGLHIVRNDSWSNGEPGIEVTWTEECLDRLNAAGSALIITDENERTSLHVFDPEVAATEVEQLIESAEKQAKAELKERENKAKENGSATGPGGQDALKEERKAEREKAKEDAAKAKVENEKIGEALLKRSTKALPKREQLETVRLMAKVMVRQADNLAASGMRLCFASWKEVEIKELKSGAKREKVTYTEPQDAEVRLIESIDNAKSVDEILRIVTDALVAATFTDEKELPQSKRVNSYSTDPIRRVHRPEMELIDRLAKGVLPEDAEKKREKSLEAGYESHYFSYTRGN